MRRILKVRPQQPVDVSHLQRLTPEEQDAQRCDPRSAIAEMSADPNIPIKVSDDHPNLGGRRLFIGLFNALYEQVPLVRKSRLQKPNLKALHLHSAAFHWQQARDLLLSLTRLDHNLQEEVEETGMDFMEAAIASVYNAVATIEIFSQEIIFDKLKAKAHIIGRPDSLVDTLRDTLPKLTNKKRPTQTTWWRDFQSIHRARNSFTHTGMKEQGREEKLARAWEALLKPDLDPPDVARRIMCHFSENEPDWIPGVIEHAQARAKARNEARLATPCADSDTKNL